MDPVPDPMDADAPSRLRAAVDLVLHDVTACLGAGAVAVYIEGDGETQALASLTSTNPELLESITRPGRSLATPEAWVFVPGDTGAIGLDSARFASSADLVVDVAETVQELVMESSPFFGAAFPPCPEHPNTPLWPQVRDGEAVWVCVDGGATARRVGTIASH